MADVLSWLGAHPYFWPLFIFCARVTDVSIGTMRTIFVVRGYRLIAAVLGFFEVTVWLMAVSSVIGNLHRWPNIVAYGLGFATGNAVGMWLEQKVALGMQTVRIISPPPAAAVAEALRFAGCGPSRSIQTCLLPWRTPDRRLFAITGRPCRRPGGAP